MRHLSLNKQVNQTYTWQIQGQRSIVNFFSQLKLNRNQKFKKVSFQSLNHQLWLRKARITCPQNFLQCLILFG